MTVERLSWPDYAMSLAYAATLRCEDPYVQVGACCLRHDHTVASIGYNGAPSGVEVDWSDRDKRRPLMLHAEINCLKYVRPGEGKILAVTLIPCPACLATIAAHRIEQVFYSKEDWSGGSAHDLLRLADQLGVSMQYLPPAVSIQKLSKSDQPPIAATYQS